MSRAVVARGSRTDARRQAPPRAVPLRPGRRRRRVPVLGACAHRPRHRPRARLRRRTVACDSRPAGRRRHSRTCGRPRRRWPTGPRSPSCAQPSRSPTPARRAWARRSCSLLRPRDRARVRSRLSSSSATASGWARCDLRVGRHRVRVRRTQEVPASRPRRPRRRRSRTEVVWEEKRRQDWLRGSAGHVAAGVGRLLGCAPRARLVRVRPRVRRDRAPAYGTDISDLGHVIVARSA